MARLAVLVFAMIIAGACCLPLNKEEPEGVAAVASMEPAMRLRLRQLFKRFVHPSYSVGDFASPGFDSKMRTKRSAEECEKLHLCKLHARSQRNFISSFELYFVNKENAHLWDHRTHSEADCEQRYSCGGSGESHEQPAAAAAAPAATKQQYQFIDDDYY